MSLSAQFNVVEVNREFVYIEDIGEHERVRTITNDAENVTSQVCKMYPGRRIFYKDSLNDFDELKHDGTNFTSFGPIPEKYFDLILNLSR